MNHAGRLDLIVGDAAGYVWYYENLGTRDKPVYAEGKRFELADGKPLVAGTNAATPVTDFTVLQGSRAVPACGEFNRDGLTDLAVGDSTGGVTYFENAGAPGRPRFARGVPLGRFSGRVHAAAGDLNGDGTP